MTPPPVPAAGAVPERRVAAVTGASGGLGRALVAELVARGMTVRAGVRSTAGEALVSALGAEPVRVDVRDPDAVAGLVAGADVVHHLAAWMGVPARQAVPVTVDGTRHVVAAAAAAGVRRVVHASSIAVYGPVSAGRIAEDTPVRTVGDPYGDAKVAAEQAARAACGGARAAVSSERGRSGTELVILRPTMIYGPASTSWTLAPVGAIARGLPVALGDGSGLLDAVYVDDVARAFALAGDAEGAAGRAFNVTGEVTSVEALFGAYAAILGTRLRHLPAWLARAGARVGSVVTGLLPGVDRLAPEMVETLLSAATFDGSAAAEVLGYRPAVSLDEGLSNTAAWLRREGLARGPVSAVVVGAATGLGREVVRVLTARHVRVHAVDVSPEALVELERQEPRLRGSAVADATSEEDLAAAVGRIEQAEGGIDMAVTTVGALVPGALETQPLAGVMGQLTLNALAPVLVARAVAPGMRARGHGLIVSVGSTNGVLVTPFMGAYSAGKFALEAFTDALRLELRPFGVDVVLVRPGAMATGFAARAKAGLEREAARTGPPWDEYLLRLKDADLWGERGATQPGKVAQVVADTGWRRPRARVAGTWDAPLVAFFATLPDRVKDVQFVRALGLARPARRRGRRRASGGGGRS